jgi:mitochondrial enoyl-[acyl-carrier protein] reductase / trans-2-enoyl-CoA reductase
VRALCLSMTQDVGPSVALVELPEPIAGPGQLLVELLASPISPMDRLMIRGLYPLPIAGGLLGAQGVGRVLAHGDGVEGPAIGTAVLLPIRCGAWRERLTVPADAVVPLAPGRDPISACTARVEGLSALVLLGELEPGEWFMHSPGAGSVGRFMTQLAGPRGLRSIALVGSSDPIAELWGLGADNVLVREPNLAARLSELGLPRPRVAFDGSGGASSELLASCLAPAGELIVYGAISRRPIQVAVAELVFREVQVRGFWLHRWAQRAGPERVRAALDELLDADLHEPIIACHRLDDWAAALACAEAGDARGRVVFT